MKQEGDNPQQMDWNETGTPKQEEKMEKHIPGSWEVEDWGDHYVVRIPTSTYPGESVQYIPISCTGNDKANAHLISAAPELLEAVESLVQEYNPCEQCSISAPGCRNECGRGGTIASAEAIIAKAKGNR